MKKINFGIALLLFGFICLYVSQGLGMIFMILGFIFSCAGLFTSFLGFMER